ncbi:MAG: glutamine--fructose-6-phosphate transaminase (isomerizing) [Candidatus Kapaibacterium sp.]
MCGIVGYIGHKAAAHVVVEGLRMLEYRGYDSAGIAVVSGDRLSIVKRKGKVADLEQTLDYGQLHGTLAIGHTRWATHGAPNDVNAHPHTDATGKIAIIHNGIIENYHTLKAQLAEKGYTFSSETDSEVLAVLIGYIHTKVHDVEAAVRLALHEVTGTFGLVVVSEHDPDTIIVARRGSPIVIGVGDDEYMVASDASAIVEHMRKAIYLNDNEMAVLTRDGFTTKTMKNQEIHAVVHELDFELEQIQRGHYDHFMLKEIFEQPLTFQDSIRGRLLVDDGNVKLGGLTSVRDVLLNARRIIFTACGTSWHSALVGEYLIEQLAHIPVEVEYASEFRYRNPIVSSGDVVIGISQSGETADTLAALREAKLKGATTLGLVNVVGSTIARETDAGVYLHAGPEIGVASTKAFTSQLAVISLLALYLGRHRAMGATDGKAFATALAAIPEKIRSILDTADAIKSIADEYASASNFLYLGRGFNFPAALEGALKLKEISYIHAEGYPAAEMKHGPIALIDENMPVVFIATNDEIYEKVVSNIEEVRARGGKVIAIATEGDTTIASRASHVIYIPSTLAPLTPVLASIPLQLLAYYIAVKRGCDVDKPRNLAKSVTVE